MSKKTPQSRWDEAHPEVVAASKQRYEDKFDRINWRSEKKYTDWVRSQAKKRGCTQSKVLDDLVEKAQQEESDD